jgi:hypothetical protein
MPLGHEEGVETEYQVGDEDLSDSAEFFGSLNTYAGVSRANAERGLELEIELGLEAGKEAGTEARECHSDFSRRTYRWKCRPG